VDKVKIEVKGGKGGDGCVSFEGLSPGRKRPSGGSGGKGGNVYVVADLSLTSLHLDKAHFIAGDGSNGSSQGMKGRNGRDLFIRVPLGTTITNLSDELYNNNDNNNNNNNIDDFIVDNNNNNNNNNDDNEEEIEPKRKSITLLQPQQMCLVALGGNPGLGNGQLHSLSNHSLLQQGHHRRKKYPGQTGQCKLLLLELQVMADVGLVGFPNAGNNNHNNHNHIL
jgi:GTPase